MSDSDSWESVESAPYNERAEWRDLVPIPQYDGPAPVLPIAYSPKCPLPVYADNTGAPY